MTKKELADLLRKSVWDFNRWRMANPDVEVDLSGEEFNRLELVGVDLSGVDLSEAKFYRCNLSLSILSGANLTSARMSNSNLSWVNFSEADLSSTVFFASNIWGIMGVNRKTKKRIIKELKKSWE